MSRHLVLPLCGVIATLLSWSSPVLVLAEDSSAPKDGAVAANPGATYKLAYKYHDGDAVRYETVHKVKFISEFKGTSETATNCTETQKQYRVTKVHPDGSAELELIIEWVRMKVNFGGDDPGTEFDSKEPGAESQAKFRNVMKIIGKPQATLLCAPSGKVLKVAVVKANAAEVGKAGVQLKDVAAQDDFSFLTIFPEKPLKIGDSWSEKSDTKVTVDQNLKQTIDLKRTYKLDSVNGNLATISFRTVVLTPNLTPSIEVQLIQRETYGKLVFDMELGAVVSRNVETDKTLIKPAGDNTAMRAASLLVERSLTKTAEVSEVPSEGTKK